MLRAAWNEMIEASSTALPRWGFFSGESFNVFEFEVFVSVLDDEGMPTNIDSNDHSFSFKVFDYIDRGGIRSLISEEILMNKLENAHECWDEGSSIIYTFNYGYYSLDLIVGKKVIFRRTNSSFIFNPLIRII